MKIKVTYSHKTELKFKKKFFELYLQITNVTLNTIMAPPW